MIDTVELVVAQGPLETVHCKTVVAPAVSPVTVEVGEVGVVTVPVPLTTLQTPLPKAGAVAPRVAVVEQTVWLLPATEADGAWNTVIDWVVVQYPNEYVTV